ncbi:hypothetical protein JCM10450v2_005093 [Rhodotorula kratochvilovae]
MVASFNSLPTELVEFIVEMVHAQDTAFQHHALERGVPGEPGVDEDGEAKPDVFVDVASGRWSFWYSRGIKALAGVNKRLRELAVPLLYEHVEMGMFATSFFRDEVVGEPLGQHVLSIELRLGVASALLEVACALRKLPNVTELSLNAYAGKVLDGVAQTNAPDEDAKLCSQSLRNALGRVTVLCIEGYDQRRLCTVLQTVDASRLRSLMFMDALCIETTHGQAFLDAVHALVALEELAFGMLSATAAADWATNARFPSLRILGFRLGRELSYEAGLRVAHCIAPALTSLRINTGARTLKSEPDPPLPSPILPTLRRLVFCKLRSYEPLIDKHLPPHLALLDVEIYPPVDTFPLPLSVLSPSPSNLRSVSLTFSSSAPLPVPADFTAACTAADVHLGVYRTPSTERWFRRPLPGARDVSAHASAEQAAAVCETLDWARRRAEWLLEADDPVGLQELAEATLRLRERQVIDST